jgi:hypothetical protein
VGVDCPELYGVRRPDAACFERRKVADLADLIGSRDPRLIADAVFQIFFARMVNC